MILTHQQRYRLRTAEHLWQTHGRAFVWHDLAMWALNQSSPAAFTATAGPRRDYDSCG